MACHPLLQTSTIVGRVVVAGGVLGRQLTLIVVCLVCCWKCLLVGLLLLLLLLLDVLDLRMGLLLLPVQHLVMMLLTAGGVVALITCHIVALIGHYIWGAKYR